MIPFDKHLLFVLHEVDAPMTAKELAVATFLEDVTDHHIRLGIARLRRKGIGIVNWPGRRGGYILRTREDLLFPHSVGSVVAELDAKVSRRSMH